MLQTGTNFGWRLREYASYFWYEKFFISNGVENRRVKGKFLEKL